MNEMSEPIRNDSQRGLEPLAISVVIIVLIANGWISYANSQRLRKYDRWVSHTHQVLFHVESYQASLIDAETGGRGFLLTGDESFLEPYESGIAAVAVELEAVDRLTEDGSSQQMLLPKLKAAGEAALAQLAMMVADRRDGELTQQEVMVAVAEGKRLMDQLRELVSQFGSEERELLRSRESEAAELNQNFVTTTMLSTLVGLALVGGIIAIIQRNRRRTEQAAAEISDQRKRADEARANKLVSDRQLADFVEQVSDYAIFLIGPDLKAASWNRGVEQVLGYTEEEFLGRDILEAIFLPESVADGTAQGEFVIAKKEGEANDDRWMKRKGGQAFWASGITTAVFDDAGKLLGFNKVLRNLTDRKLAEEELKALAAELSEADRNKTMFLATLAHELRNPLSPIKNTVQLLSRSKLNQDVQELLDVMERQVEQMARLIDDLMDVSRISRGKVELRREWVPLRGIVDSAVEASAGLMAGNGQRFSLQWNVGDLYMLADPARISQVISNLLNNASKYSPENTPITLQVNRVDGLEDGSLAEMIVSDEGIGIAEAEQDEVFKMFSQLAESVERGSSGLGIGLTLVKNFIEMHGGSVAVFSEGVGRGSQFTVRLPVVDAAEVQTTTEVFVDTVTVIKSFRVLVVDDSRSITFVMERLLKSLGQTVQTAVNGLLAVDAMKTFDPQIVFSDISMPGMNGYELAKYIRATPAFSDLYLVAMTGFGQPTDREKAIQAGFDDHVVKPVDFSVIERLLRQRSQ
ncbi:hybrid sensor histidine kinase/response regulator [Neorhodopirellula pilleata]|uniref:histidine kinase n=1 Tax=Neorhodopirellula pilleata TaxID=2714738 RepID=A0A5C5ZW18_9BACT|nr:CHASE3 domain-containing protein [Neorhodopirellula pilleata]TWT91181.1 Virulence sensor protein BvgS precursor [Neorhodopirellula pilleata]